jgi:hypothetical protein
MARRSGSVTTVEVPFEDWGFDFFRRGFFDTGICLVPIMLRRPADHRGSVPHVNRQTRLSTVQADFVEGERKSCVLTSRKKQEKNGPSVHPPIRSSASSAEEMA